MAKIPLPRRPLLPSPSPLRPTTSTTSSSPLSQTTHQHHPSLLATQLRHATYIPRPRRPYAFTQLVQLSDGSTYTVRTTSPHALFRSSKDVRNHVLWQPSEKSLRNVELDEAGKLAAFRGRYGKGFDIAVEREEAEEGDGGKDSVTAAKETKPGAAKQEQDSGDTDMLTDLLSRYAVDGLGKSGAGLNAKEQAKLDRKKKK